jgi:hypothetical protein
MTNKFYVGLEVALEAMIWFPIIHLTQKLVPESSTEASTKSMVKH